MSEKEMKRLVDEFLKDVKRALPSWLKDKKEHREILAELEEHVWAKAEELSSGQPTMTAVKEAIRKMGTPERIAREYKKRGTPKIYITEEMWPLYVKVLSVVFGIIVALNVIGILVGGFFEGFDLWEAIGSLVSGIQLGFLMSFTVISVIFVALSMEGYFPEDFKSKKEIEKEKLEARKAKEEGWPISPKTGEPLKPFINPVGTIIGAIFGIIFATVLILQPFPPGIFLPTFSFLLRVFGVFLMIEGFLDLIRGLIGNHQPGTHQGIHVVKALMKYVSIPFLIILMNQPEIFPIFNVSDGKLVFIGIDPAFYDLYRTIVFFVILVTALSSIEDYYRIYKLQEYKV